ncbi:MAG: hypothetical protein OXF99_01230 [bacterium]|nr:hypothetical protein [bacterium]
MSQVSPQVARTGGAFIGLRGKLLAHLSNNDDNPMASRHADGVIFRGSAGFQAARLYSKSGIRIIDEERYRADRDNAMQLELIPRTPQESIHAQLAAGADCLLAPSRFPTDRSHGSIEALIADGEAFLDAANEMAPQVPAFIPTIIRYDELSDGRWVGPLRSAGLPIATIFAAYGDPLEDPHQLEGALEVIQSVEVSLVMRNDISVAGLITLGALAGAVGTSSAVRHLWLPRKRGNARPARSIFVPETASWMKIPFVEQAQADPDLDAVFRCSCSVCGPGGDVRHLTLPEVCDSVQDEHSVAAAIQLARSVIRGDDPVASWLDVCQRAVALYDELDRLGVSGPRKPGALVSWISVLA